jgi:hypothetical protein
MPDFVGDGVLWHSPVGDLSEEGNAVAMFQFAGALRGERAVRILPEAVRLYYVERIETRPGEVYPGRWVSVSFHMIQNALDREDFRPKEKARETREALRAAITHNVFVKEFGNDPTVMYQRFVRHVPTGTLAADRRALIRPSEDEEKIDREIVHAAKYLDGLSALVVA